MNKLLRSFFLVLSTLLLSASTVLADDAQKMFPFAIEKGAPENITNVQTWTESTPVAGSDGFVAARGDAFATDSGARRLLGTNFCYTANFPTKENAERVAATLARFGVNAVRLHFMDNREIWGKNFERSTTEIDPEQLDRLDYLVYSLRQRGIYSNLNLHVGRVVKECDGFENADRLPRYNKGVDNFCRKLIDLQKQYAKDLLLHINPYTGLSYADDPCVAVVEINNENSVVASWAWGQLDDLPSPYADEFRRYWNDWLLKKYGSDEGLREAWNCGTFPLGEEMIPDGAFDASFRLGADKWRLDADESTKQTCEILPPEKSGLDRCAVRFTVEDAGRISWLPQLVRTGLTLEKGKPYRCQFKIRSERNSSIAATIQQDREPWNALSTSYRFDAAPEWQDCEFSFVAPESGDRIKLMFSGFQSGTSIDLADVSLKEGGTVGLDESQTLADETVPLIRRAQGADMMGARSFLDFADFLYDLENDYWLEMRDYIRSLGAKQPTSGTQLRYGYWHSQARLDYCDIHAYWNSAYFPRRSWDLNDWLIRNTSLANEPCDGSLAILSSLRVLGRPYVCSEYDHPFPNQYCAEGNVMLAAVAAFQDWSATFQYAWSQNDNFERGAADFFFDECAQTVKLAHLPACYGIFVRGDVRRGPGEFVYAPKMSESREMEIMRDLLTGYHRDIAPRLGLDRSLTLAVYSGIELPDLALPKSPAREKATSVDGWEDLPERFGSKEKKEIVNDFGEIRWNFQEEGKGFFTVDTANTKVFSGFVTKPCEFDALTLDVGETALGWATVSLVKGTDAEPNAEKTGKLTSGRYLLTLTGDMKNTDSKLVAVGDDVTTAVHFGGNLGVAPVLCEGVSAKLTLKGLGAERVEVYALDARGERAARVGVESIGDDAVFEVGAEYRTIWYEVVVK